MEDDIIKNLRSELVNDIIPVVTNIEKLGYDYMQSEMILNLTGHVLYVVDRLGNRWYMKDRSHEYIPTYYKNIIVNGITHPSKGIYIVREMSVDYHTNTSLEAQYDHDISFFEQYGPYPLKWTYGDNKNKSKITDTKRKVINNRFPMYQQPQPGDSIYYNPTRHYVWYIPLEDLVGNKVVYDKQSDYLFSINKGSQLPIHPRDIRRIEEYILEESKVNSEKMEFYESYFYCVEDPNSHRHKHIYKKSGKGVVRIMPRKPELDYEDNHFYVTWEEYDTETGKIVTKFDSMPIYNPSRIDHKDKFEKWLNEYGLFTDYKMAVASSKDRVDVEKVLFEKEKQSKDQEIYFEKFELEKAKLQAELFKLEKEKEKLLNEIHLHQQKNEDKRIELEDRKHRRDVDKKNHLIDGIGTVLKTGAMIITGLISLVGLFFSIRNQTAT